VCIFVSLSSRCQSLVAGNQLFIFAVLLSVEEQLNFVKIAVFVTVGLLLAGSIYGATAVLGGHFFIFILAASKMPTTRSGKVTGPKCVDLWCNRVVVEDTQLCVVHLKCRNYNCHQRRSICKNVVKCRDVYGYELDGNFHNLCTICEKRELIYLYYCHR
jgi:hypothetical protein